MSVRSGDYKQRVAMAHYEGYTDRLCVLELVRWYEVRVLVREVNYLRTINFSIVEQRQQALQRLANMVGQAPFSEHLRFPSGQLYVCETFGDWSRKFQQLRSALMAKTYVKDAGVRSGVELSADLSDAMQAFSNSLTAMLDQLTRLDGVFSQTTFEVEYNLQWRP